jgi:serine/threonine protein kinase
MYDYAFDEKTQTTYLVLEYAENGTLFDYIRSHHPKDKRLIRGIFHSVCDAIEFMHANNIMHRDIKVLFILFSRKIFYLTIKML